MSDSEAGDQPDEAVEPRSRNWQAESGRLATAAVRAGEPTAWFERLYAAGDRGEIDMPWDRSEPSALLGEWLRTVGPGTGRPAVVVGCGLGVDAELVAAHGFATTGFDVSATAIRTAGERHPETQVDYRTADLLALPEEWRRAFALVVEIITVQALPATLRERAVAAVADLVAPGGSLFVVEYVQAEGEPLPDRPPWPFTRAEIASFARNGLTEVTTGQADQRWRAEFARPRPR